MNLLKNSGAVLRPEFSSEELAMFGRDGMLKASEYIKQYEGYQPTPLLSLSSLAKSLGVKNIFYKDEASRLGLQSFKALGGAYAVIRCVHRLVEEKTGVEIPVQALYDGQYEEIVQDITVACATDGNHGRSVSWGAKLIGCQCKIFLHEGVSTERELAITSLGAETIRVPGVYDDSVQEATQVAASNGWHIVADTTSLVYDRAAADVMQGYTVMVDEILSQVRDQDSDITHVFVQGGVGGLGAAVAGHMLLSLDCRPIFIMVEPENANCLLRSAEAGVAVRLEENKATCMAMLECYKPSVMAWQVIKNSFDYFMDIPEQAAQMAMCRLAEPLLGDPVIEAGESGAAGIAGLLMVSQDYEAYEKLAIDNDSTIVIIGSEGVTDRKIYEALMGKNKTA